MTDDKVLEVLVDICCRLRFFDPTRITETTDLGCETRYEDRMKHTHWMALEAQEFVIAGRREKAMRWLGFIQAGLWWAGMDKIAELKGANRP